MGFFLFVYLFYVLFIETRSQVAEDGLHVAETDLELLTLLPLPSQDRDLQIMPPNLIFMW